MSIAIRPATAADAGAILRLVRLLAAFEREPPSSVRLTETDIRRDGFGPERRFEALLAERDRDAIGFALFFPVWSTWEGRSGLHVEDLFVVDEARGQGVGRRLMAEIARIAEARGCTRINLSVLDWNPARQFYEGLGFVEMAEWRDYRLTGPALARLAADARRAAEPG